METEYKNVGFLTDTYERMKKKAKEFYDENKDDINKLLDKARGKTKNSGASLTTNLGQPKVW